MVFQSVSVPLLPARGSAGRRRRARRPQCVSENPLPNLFALDIASVHRGRKVNPAQDTGCTIFSRCFREAPEFARNAWIGCAARHRETDEVCVEEPGHHRSRRSPFHRMVRRVIRYRRGRKVTQPFTIATFANGSDWPPVVVMVFVFKTGDVAVGHREIHQRKQSGVLPNIELPCRRHFTCDPVPTLGANFRTNSARSRSVPRSA